MMLDSALRYAQRGIPVFPANGKLPLTEHGFKDASTNADMIRAWWERWPDANIAIPTGVRSGVIVLDVDPRHGGNESLAALQARHGPLPQTLESSTGGGGRHLFFAWPNGQTVRNSAGRLGRGLDVRAEGGYVVAPPSIHPQTKKAYRWANRLKAAPVPAWLIGRASTPTVVSGPACDAPIPSGQRNDALARFAGAMRRRGFTQEAIEAALLAENAKRCAPPLPDVEVRSIAGSISRYAPGTGNEAPSPEEPVADPKPERRPAFPRAAWRGVFAEYRAAMEGATEAADMFHFAALWARCAVALGRRVWFSYGMTLFPNVYLVCFGPTGDRKTTATRKASELGGEFRTVQGGGSGEGIADELSGARPGEGFLLYAEEFSQILRPGQWQGATLMPFLTQCFDCPPRFQMKYRKAPVELEEPTPTLLAGTTPDWFWQDFRPKDFAGGFGNRFLFLTGERKQPIPLPATPDLSRVSLAVDSLATVERGEAHFEAKSQALWREFYLAWTAEESKRDPLLREAVQRIPAYVLKLAMVYAAAEKTLPAITCDQLAAAIPVGRYGETCTAELLSLQNAGTNPRRELERRILAYVASRDGRTTKREIYRALARHYKDTEEFNRALDSLVRAGMLFAKEVERGSILVSLSPISY